MSLLNKRIWIRVSEKQFIKIKTDSKKEGLSMSSYIRFLIDYHHNNNAEKALWENAKETKKSLLYEVARQGNNLNQIAHQLNVMNYKGYSRFPHKYISEILDKVNKAIEQEQSILDNLSGVVNEHN